MQVAPIAQQATGQETPYTPVASPRVAPVERVTPADASDTFKEQRQSADREEPRDRLSPRLEALARRAAQAEARLSRQVDLNSLTSRQTDAVRQQPPPQAVQQAEQADSSKNGAPSLSDQIKEASRRRDLLPSPAEMVGLPDALARYDSNQDGRLDQLELRMVVNAKDTATTYSGLAQPQGPSGEWMLETSAEDEAWEPKKLFSEGEDGAALPTASGTVSDPVAEAEAVEAMVAEEYAYLLPGEIAAEAAGTSEPAALYGSGGEGSLGEALLPRKLYELTAGMTDREQQAAGGSRTLAVA